MFTFSIRLLRIVPGLLCIAGGLNGPTLVGASTVGREGEERLLRLAHEVVAAEVRGTEPPAVSGTSPPRPVFVTLERRGRVLGCRGALTSRTRSLETMVALAARAAAAHDPRYRPLVRQDLADLQVTITLVDELRPLREITTLQPSEGLVLQAGDRTGVVLPWEGRNPIFRLRWAYRKAGVPPGAARRLLRLIGERFRG